MVAANKWSNAIHSFFVSQNVRTYNKFTDSLDRKCRTKKALILKNYTKNNSKIKELPGTVFSI